MSHPYEHDVVVPEQLRLIEPPEPTPWQLDEHSRQVAKIGLAAARAALRAARQPTPDTGNPVTLVRPLPVAALEARRQLARVYRNDGLVIRLDQLAS